MESSVEALFQGFRPQDKLTRMTPRLHISFGAEAYGRGVDCWHSVSQLDQKTKVVCLYQEQRKKARVSEVLKLPGDI